MFSGVFPPVVNCAGNNMLEPSVVNCAHVVFFFKPLETYCFSVPAQSLPVIRKLWFGCGLLCQHTACVVMVIA